jgi:large subunit ribosomal protein L21
MFAVLKTGGKQYKVSKNDIIIVEKLSAVSGDVIQFDKVLMISDGKMTVGNPLIAGAAVLADVIEQTKNKKVMSFVKRRRKHSSQRTRGHRQNVTVLRVTALMAAGAKTNGLQIEYGATVIGSNPKIVENTKADIIKTEVVKKPAAKAKVTKKPAAKADVAKKPAAKAVVAKKPAAKAKATKKPAAKAVVAKKPAAKKTVVKNPTKS